VTKWKPFIVKELNSVDILVLNNNFHGSYNSNQIFFQNLVSAFKNNGNIVWKADTVEDAISIYKKKKIDFSISFSKYIYYEKNIALYDKFQKNHYQWVSDYPPKMNIDIKSEFIHYIFIDYEYIYLCPNILNKPIILPLGYTKNDSINYNMNKKKAILFPCKVRSFAKIKTKIENSAFRETYYEFIKSYKLDDSFTIFYSNFIKRHLNCDCESFFRTINEYYRILKRMMVIENIEKYEIYICDDKNDNFPSKKNIHYIGKVNYKEINKYMNNFMIVINVDPNYHACIHDRFIKSVNSGSVCLTNANMLINSKEYTYSFDKISLIDNIIDYISVNNKEIYLQQKDLIKRYSWKKSCKSIIEDFSKKVKNNEI